MNRVATANTDQYLTRATAIKQALEQALSESRAAADRSDREAMAVALDRVERLHLELMAIRSEQLAYHHAPDYDRPAVIRRRHKAALLTGCIGVLIGTAGAWVAHAAGII